MRLNEPQGQNLNEKVIPGSARGIQGYILTYFRCCETVGPSGKALDW